MVLTSISHPTPTAFKLPNALTSPEPMTMQEAVAQFKAFPAFEQLTFLKVIYSRVGQSITPDISGIAHSERAHRLCQMVEQVPHDQQVQVIAEILKGEETRFSHAYQALDFNTKLAFWHRLMRSIEAGTVKMPYLPMVTSVRQLLLSIEAMANAEQVEFVKCAIA